MISHELLLTLVAGSLLLSPVSENALAKFSVDGVGYEVPQQCLSHLDQWQGGPQEFVGLKLLVEQHGQHATAKCSDKSLDSLSGTTLGVYITGGSTPISNDWVTSHHSPIPGPYGFQLYSVGPRDARVDSYIKAVGDHTLAVDCSPRGAGDKREFTCSNMYRLTNGNLVNYLFGSSQLPIIEQTDGAIRAFLAHATTKADANDNGSSQ